MDFITPFLNYIKQCDSISNNKLFLNAIDTTKNAENSKQIVTSEIDRSQDREFTDGSVRHKLIFTLFDYKSISFNALLQSAMETNQNVEDLLNVQDFIDWVIEQNKNRNYPNFGTDYEVESVEPTYLTPTTPAIVGDEFPFAKYSIPIVCYVIDYSEAIR